MNKKVQIALGLLALVVIMIVITTIVMGNTKNGNKKGSNDEIVPQINLQRSEIVINPNGRDIPPLSEGYQIEYAASALTDEALSKMYDIKVIWNNLGGFENVRKLKITRTANGQSWSKTLVKNTDPVDYFRSFGGNLEVNFDGDDTDMPSGFNAIGTNTFTFEYTLGDSNTFKPLNTGVTSLQKTIPRDSITVAVDSGIRVDMTFEPTVSSLIEIEPDFKNKGYYLHPLKMTDDGTGYEVDRASSLNAFTGKRNEKITIVTITGDDSVYLKIGSMFFNPENDETNRLVADSTDAIKFKVLSIVGLGDTYNIPADSNGQGGQTNQTGRILVLAKAGTGDSDATETEVITLQSVGVFGFRKIKDITNAAEYASMRLYYTGTYLFTGQMCEPETPVKGTCVQGTEPIATRNLATNDVLLRGQQVVTYEPKVLGVGGESFHCTTPDGTRYNTKIYKTENCPAHCYYIENENDTASACNAIKKCWKDSQDEVTINKRYSAIQPLNGGTPCDQVSAPTESYTCPGKPRCDPCGWNVTVRECISTPRADVPVKRRRRDVVANTVTDTCRASPESTKPATYVDDSSCPPSCIANPIWEYSSSDCEKPFGEPSPFRYYYRTKQANSNYCKSAADTPSNWRYKDTGACYDAPGGYGNKTGTQFNPEVVGPTITNWKQI